MGSKLVINRQKSSETVWSAGTNYVGRIEDRIAKLLGEAGGHAAGVMVRAAVERLEDLTNAMIDADDAYLDEIADDTQTIDARDEATAEVRAILVDTRQLCQTVFGAEYVRQLGFDGSTPSEAVQVERLGAQVLRNLSTVPRPEANRFGLNLDVTALMEQLRPKVNQLSVALAAVAENVRQADIRLVEKRQAMDAYDSGFSATANLISTLLNLADEEELAKRVRPSARRPGQTIEDAEGRSEIIEEASEQTQIDVA